MMKLAYMNRFCVSLRYLMSAHLLGVIVCCSPFCALPANAQKPHGLFYSLDASTSNLYTSAALNLAKWGLSAISPFGMSYNFHYDYLNFEDDGEDIVWRYGDPIGVKASDLFSHIRLGGKFGYLSAKSPVGIYAGVNYCFRRFEMNRYRDGYDTKKFKLQTFEPEVGVRISPLVYMWDDYGWCPLFEFSTTLVENTKCRGGYDNDMEQFKDGLRTSYSIGINLSDEYDILEYFDLTEKFESCTIILTYERANFSLFNTDYSPDGGYHYPYANMKSKNWKLFISLNVGF